MSSMYRSPKRARVAKNVIPREVQLRPLIAPKASDHQLPSIKDLQLLKEGRGIVPPPSQPETETDADYDFLLNGRLLKEYQIIGKTYVMQAPLANETLSVHTRLTAGGRQLTYKLEIAQQPERARACGSGPRSSADRRPVDPPPVVRLTILHNGIDITNQYTASWQMFASLEHARPIAKGTIYATNHCPVLTGGVHASAAILTKPVQAAYFIFPDMSIRHEGYYRFKFCMFEQPKNRADYNHDQRFLAYPGGNEDAPAPEPTHDFVNYMSVYSKPFQVFSAKKFPGLTKSTELSKIIADQGCRVRIRRDIRQRKNTVKAGGKDDDQRDIRASSHDRIGSIDSQGPWNGLSQPDTRRPSVDSTVSASYGPSRHASYAQTGMSSPIVPGTPSQYGYTPYESSVVASPIAAEPQETYPSAHRHSSYQSLPPIQPAPQYQQPIQRMGPPSMARSSYTPIAPSPSTMPSLSAMMNPTPIEPARPAGGLYTTTPSTQKRSASRMSNSPQASALKDGARPTLSPSSRYNNSTYGTTAPGTSSKFPANGLTDVIEADDDEDNEDGDYEHDVFGADEAHGESDSEDSLLGETSVYRRANGARGHCERWRRSTNNSSHESTSF